MRNPYLLDRLFSLALLFLILVSVNIMLFPDIPGYLGVNPHPYLIAVLFMAARFGRSGGYLSAATAVLLLGFSLYREYAPHFQPALLRQAEFLSPVVSFVFTALFVGELQHANQNRQRSLLVKNRSLRSENHRLKEQLEVVIQIKEELENRLVGQQNTVHSLYQAARALETLEEEEFYRAMARLAARFTGATRVSFYLIDYPNDCIRCVARFGWPEEEQSLPPQKLGEGIFNLVLQENRVLTIKEIAENKEHLRIWENTGNRAYVYVPISIGSVIIGFLTVDEVPFLKLNVSMVRTLSLIAELAVPTLKNIIQYQDLQNMVQMDPITGLPKYAAFVEDAEIEFKKAARYHLDFSLIVLQLQGLDEVEREFGHERVVEALKWFGGNLKSMLRSMDLLGLGETEGEFFLALPVTDSEGMLEVIDRIVAWFEEMRHRHEWGESLRLGYGAVAYHPTIKSLEHMQRLARHSLRINKISKAKQLS